MRHWTATPNMALIYVLQSRALFYPGVAMVAWSSLWSEQTSIHFVPCAENCAIAAKRNYPETGELRLQGFLA